MAKKSNIKEAGKKKAITSAGRPLASSKAVGKGDKPSASKRPVATAPDKAPVRPARLMPKKPSPVETPMASRKTGNRRPETSESPESEPLGTAARPGGNGHVPEVSDEPVRSFLTQGELAEFRQMLIDKHNELVGDVTHLESEAMGQNGPGGGGLSSMPIHMADLGTDTWEQELTLGLIENERGLLREIDEALDRIQNKTFGICLATNKPIAKARLRAKPWAKYCIEYARKLEIGRI